MTLIQSSVEDLFQIVQKSFTSSFHNIQKSDYCCPQIITVTQEPIIIIFIHGHNIKLTPYDLSLYS